MSQKKEPSSITVAKNPKAYHDYTIEDTLEAGLMLLGSEVKSLRNGKASIKEAYATAEEGNIYLINATISEYKESNQFNHDSKRKRKLLLHKREILQLTRAIQRKGITLVPLSIYFNKRGIAKLSLGIASGKKQHDKRAAEKEKDWKRDKARLMKDRH